MAPSEGGHSGRRKENKFARERKRERESNWFFGISFIFIFEWKRAHHGFINLSHLPPP